MNTETGEITQLDPAALAVMPSKEKIKFVRDFTLKEQAEKQSKLYSPCGCGSKKKFKFCCYKK